MEYEHFLKNGDSIFYINCLEDNVDILKILYEFGLKTHHPINIRAQNDQLFIHSCYRGATKSISFLESICSKYSHKIIDDKITPIIEA